MSNNQGKNVVMSIIGIAILVVAVVGVSFAFFTYSRTGAQNNIITAGKISFTFADSQFITLTNHFPVSTDTGSAMNAAGQTCTFSVTGNTTTNSTINYAVWAIPGDNSSQAVLGENYANFTTKFADSEVFVNIQSTDVANTTFVPVTNTTTKGKAISTLATTASNVGTVPTNGKLLGTGTITGTGSDITRNFTVRMWVDSSVVSVGEGTTSKVYTVGEYSHLYYTMKIVVTAQQ